MKIGRVITILKDNNETQGISEAVIYDICKRDSYSFDTNFANLITKPEYDIVETVFSAIDVDGETYHFLDKHIDEKFVFTDFVVKDCENFVFKDILNLFINHKKFFGEKTFEKFIDDKKVKKQTVSKIESEIIYKALLESTELVHEGELVKQKRKYTKKVKQNG